MHIVLSASHLSCNQLTGHRLFSLHGGNRAPDVRFCVHKPRLVALATHACAGFLLRFQDGSTTAEPFSTQCSRLQNGQWDRALPTACVEATTSMSEFVLSARGESCAERCARAALQCEVSPGEAEGRSSGLSCAVRLCVAFLSVLQPLLQHYEPQHCGLGHAWRVRQIKQQACMYWAGCAQVRSRVLELVQGLRWTTRGHCALDFMHVAFMAPGPPC